MGFPKAREKLFKSVQGEFISGTGGGIKRAVSGVAPPIQFCPLRNCPGALLCPRTPCIKRSCNSHSNGRLTGNVAKRASP